MCHHPMESCEFSHRRLYRTFVVLSSSMYDDMSFRIFLTYFATLLPYSYFCIALVHFFRGSLLSGECLLEQLPLLLVDNGNDDKNKYAVLEQVVARCLLLMEYSDTEDYDGGDDTGLVKVENNEVDDGKQQERFMDAVPTQARMPPPPPPAWFTAATAPTDMAVLQRLEFIRQRKRQRLPLLVDDEYASASRYGTAATTSHDRDGAGQAVNHKMSPPPIVSRDLRVEFDLQATTSLLGRGTASSIRSGNGGWRMGTGEKILLFLLLILAAMAAVWDFSHNAIFVPPFISRQDAGGTFVQPSIAVDVLDDKSLAHSIIMHPSPVVPAKDLLQDGTLSDKCDETTQATPISITSSRDDGVERATPARAAANSTIFNSKSASWKSKHSAASIKMDRLRGSLTSLGGVQMERLHASLSTLRSVGKCRKEDALAVASKLKSVGQRHSQQLQNVVRLLGRSITYRTRQSWRALNASACRVIRATASLERFGQEKLLHAKGIASSAGAFASLRFMQLKDAFTLVASTTHAGVLDAKGTVATVALQGRRQVGLTACRLRKNADFFFHNSRAVISNAADAMKHTLGSAAGRIKTRSQLIRMGAAKSLDRIGSNLTAEKIRLATDASTTAQFLKASVLSLGSNVKTGVSIIVRHVSPKARQLRQRTTKAVRRLGSDISTQRLRASNDLHDTVHTLQSSVSLGGTKVAIGTVTVGRSVLEATRQKGKQVAMKMDLIWNEYTQSASWMKERSSFHCRRLRDLVGKQWLKVGHSTRRLGRAFGTIRNKILNGTDVALSQFGKASGEVVCWTRRVGREGTTATKAGLNVTVVSLKEL